MFQKVENIYLMILRVAVILVATLLLIATGVFTFRSANAFVKSGGTTTTRPIHVSASDLIPEILGTKQNSAGEQLTGGRSVTASVDPNQVYYDRAATTVNDFVVKYTHGSQSVRKQQFEGIIKKQAQSQDDPSLQRTYAQNFSTFISDTLSNPGVINAANHSSPEQLFEIVWKAMDAFDTNFGKQVASQQVERDTEQQETTAEKAEGLQSIYIAASCLGTFLLVVFLFIFIRIERSLRNLAPSQELVASRSSLV